MNLIILFSLILFCASFCITQRTNFVDEDSKLVDFAEKQWFKDNIPFLEVPDDKIEAVYYYRWSSLKRHLRYTVPGAGYIVTEFVHKVGYSQKYDTINAAAGHHIDEARWLRDTDYVKDYINVWAREGAGNQQYSEWIADSAYNAFLLNADLDFIKSQQKGLEINYLGWSDRFEPEYSLFFISPHDDAMEHSASSEQTDDPYHGGLGYRPSHNGEMYANALAIANIAKLNSDTATAQEYEDKAEAIRKGMLEHLWDPERKFFYHVYREDNPSLDYLDTREEIGFFPWRWNIPPVGELEYEEAWEQLFDPQGFNTLFGPTTCEVRSKWYDGDQTGQCCWWNGNSWPYSTGHTLRALAAQVKRYRPTMYANVDSYHGLLNQYARTQYKNGKPYVAECHSPIGDFWVCDAKNGSDHYAHSTYNDNVLSDLIGIEPQADNTFQVNPLVPSNWTYFIAENIPYHGHNVTVLYDRDGTKYSTGSMGMQIYVNGELVGSQEEVGLMNVPIPPPSLPIKIQRMENYATNVQGYGYPEPAASHTASTDSSVWQAVDGRIFYDFTPSNRWSNFGNEINATDWFSVNFGPGRKKSVGQAKVLIYSDVEFGGEIDCPASISIEYFDTSSSTWMPTEDQTLTPVDCVPNDIWTIDFKPITTQQLRVVFNNNIEKKTWVGITELQIWAVWPQTSEEGLYEAEDGLLGNQIGMYANPTASGGSYVGQINNADGWVEFPGVWADSAGDYTLSIQYSNAAFSPAMLNMTINNFHKEETTFPPTGGSWADIELEVPLWRGNNVIIFNHIDKGAINLDRIKIQV